MIFCPGDVKELEIMATINGFIKKNLLHDHSVGAALKMQRETLGLTIDDVFRHTGIQPHYLVGLEEDNQHALPGMVYAKKYLSTYARFIGISEEALALMDDSFLPRAPLQLRPTVSPSRFTVWPRRITRLLLGATVGIFLVILGARLFTRFSPPDLQLIYPPEGYMTHLDSLALSGKTEPEARVTVNGEALVPSTDGSFSLIVRLTNGVNIFNITSQRRFGTRAEVNVQVVKNGMAFVP